MTNIRRYFLSGNYYFMTHVTHNRAPILVEHFDILWAAICDIKNRYPFEIIAWCILPDHVHILINPGQTQISAVMRRIKLSFANRYRNRIGVKRGRIWQNRFWDHQIRNEIDLNRHIDYIHYNAVKHGLVDAPTEYRYSSFANYFREGYYAADWGILKPRNNNGDFGE